jgi:spore maturation protein A
VRFAKIKAVQEAGIESAKDAVQLAIGLIGTLALWLGLMKIAEASGLVNVLVRVVQPLLRPLFPSVPPGHPALGAIALNVAANMLGLGNAATPFGIKAMEELQKLNPSDDTATDGMVMLLAINTAGVQLVPAGTLVALMGVAAGEVFLPMLVVTGIALVIAIVSAKVLGRLPAYRRTNPDRLARATSSPLLTSETEAAS